MLNRLKTAVSSVVSFVKRNTERLALAVVTATATVFASSSAHAAGDIDDLFTAFNITGLQTNIKTILLAGVVISTLFVGYRFLKKAGGRL